jgi:hypothetical protein
MPEDKTKDGAKRAMKTVEFTPERQKEVRAAAVQAKEMLFDLETGNVFFVGRGTLDLRETVMRLTIMDVAHLAGQMLNISAATLIEAIGVAKVAGDMASNPQRS